MNKTVKYRRDSFHIVYNRACRVLQGMLESERMEMKVAGDIMPFGRRAG